MGTRRRRQRQEELWYRADLAEAPGQPLVIELVALGFAKFVEPCIIQHGVQTPIKRRDTEEGYTEYLIARRARIVLMLAKVRCVKSLIETRAVSRGLL
jgi:hypothetical protein